jgi:hypothetical protein
MILDPIVARDKLIARQVYTAATAPSIEQITSLLEEIEIAVSNWLGFYPGRKEYGELLATNACGNLVTTNYPILTLKGIKRPHDRTVDLLVSSTFNLVWQGGIRELNLGYPDTRCWVIYDAGYEPIPAEIVNGTWNALKSVLFSVDQDPSSLGEFYGTERAVELPDGLKTEYFSPKEMGATGGGTGGGTAMDRAMGSATKYRRSQITMTAGFE